MHAVLDFGVWTVLGAFWGFVSRASWPSLLFAGFLLLIFSTVLVGCWVAWSTPKRIGRLIALFSGELAFIFEDKQDYITTEDLDALRARWGIDMGGMRDALLAPLLELQKECARRDIPTTALRRLEVEWKRIWSEPVVDNLDIYVQARSKIDRKLLADVKDTLHQLRIRAGVTANRSTLPAPPSSQSRGVASR